MDKENLPLLEAKKIGQSDAEKVVVTTPWGSHPFFKYSAAILLVLSILLVFYHVANLFEPVFEFISTLFAPIAISLLFYYLLRPIISFFERRKIPRTATIIAIYILLAFGILFFIAYVGPILTKQITALANTSVITLDKVRESSRSILFRLFNVDLDYEIEQRLLSMVKQVTSILSSNLVVFFSVLTRLAAIMAVIPFIVFYLLKDDRDFALTFLRNAPQDYSNEMKVALNNMDATLSNYITGLALVSFSVGCMLFIGYLIIGLDYALILSMIAIIFMTIPFLGPFLAAAPAILVGFSDSPSMMLKVAIVFLIVQQIESNAISPQIIGHRLNIHPLTIILLLLAAGTLYGLAGLLLATPLYALGKCLIENGYKIARLHYASAKIEH